MIKFWITNRPRPDQTREEFDYEWGVMHLSLMATTKAPMTAFQGYVQHRSVDGITDDLLIHSLPREKWYGIADHWLNGLEDLYGAMDEEYRRRMQPHNFADSAFILELTSGEVLYDQPETALGKGGVKLVTFLKRRADISQDEFERQWREVHAEKFLHATTVERDLVRRYVQNPQLPLDPATFKGTLFEVGGCQTYAGIEEVWFDNLDALTALRTDESLGRTLTTSEQDFVDIEGSFSMVVVERLVFDRTDPACPQPAILNPASFEARIAASEREPSEWNTIVPVERQSRVSLPS
jgi:EthD domain